MGTLTGTSDRIRDVLVSGSIVVIEIGIFVVVLSCEVETSVARPLRAIREFNVANSALASTGGELSQRPVGAKCAVLHTVAKNEVDAKGIY